MQTQQQASFAEGFHPKPGSNVLRSTVLSDCVLAVAFTLFVVNIPLCRWFN